LRVQIRRAGFTFSLAAELQRTGITVNVIRPGVIGAQIVISAAEASRPDDNIDVK
jgi:NAD(P)-dependent dehydrogenase (short-subunit alcohol dehydrogenase family)